MSSRMNPAVARVTDRIREKSRASRAAYLERMRAARNSGPPRGTLSCGNLAHGMAACGTGDKERLAGEAIPNIGIVSAYNDMLSAHQPLEAFPAIIKRAAGEVGAVAQFAGGVPAMCDGVTQGQDGMDLSLFSRDVIAMATAVALSHNMFDAALCLGVCDKIVPGLLIGSLAFGHLPVAFVPGGPMLSGLPNREKARVREEFAAGRIGRDELLAAECASYHGPGTCTFYGTANSNQMMMEFLGLQLPGGSFVNPNTPMREALTAEVTRTVLDLTAQGDNYRPLAEVVDESAIVNAIVGLCATGGSTNHTMHLVAIAAAAGIRVDWTDFAELSAAVPLLAQVYPNGMADVNHFHAAGGLGFVIRELLDAGLLHRDVKTIRGDSLDHYCREPFLDGESIGWRPAQAESLDSDIVRPVADAFDREGGIRLLQGNLGRAIVKVSAVAKEHCAISAPARVFASQDAFTDAFKAGELDDGDFVAVLPGQGALANGMPELHKLTPFLGVLQNRGQRVALLTDGRMSGASGKVLAAIQVTPEAAQGGSLARVHDGDRIEIDAAAGVLRAAVDGTDWESREVAVPDLAANRYGTGRELFAPFRASVTGAEQGATVFPSP